MHGDRTAVSIDLKVDRERQRQIEREGQIDPELQPVTALHRIIPHWSRRNSALGGSFRPLRHLMQMPRTLVDEWLPPPALESVAVSRWQSLCAMSEGGG